MKGVSATQSINQNFINVRRKETDHSNLNKVLQTRSVIGKNNPLLPPSLKAKPSQNVIDSSNNTKPKANNNGKIEVTKRDLVKRVAAR